MKTLLDWILISVIALAIAVCCIMMVKSARAQVDFSSTTTTTEIYEYEGWTSDTKLRRRSGDAIERPPEPNERLYEYKGGIQQDGYWQWDGYTWQKQGDAKREDLEE
jgi:hypothetical protein